MQTRDGVPEHSTSQSGLRHNLKSDAWSTDLPSTWADVAADEVSDALIAAMALGGVEYLFFNSGSELIFMQEAIAKAQARGSPAPKLITMTHEGPSLHAALGYSAVTGKPSATAAHVDVGTQNYGCAVHNAWASRLPVLITAGTAPVAYPGSMPGARDGGHFWAQQPFDQNGIVRPYVKWDHRLDYQDNPGLIVSRALQVAQSDPGGPVYLSVPRELAYLPLDRARFPTAGQLGFNRRPAPDANAIREIAERLVKARNPFVVVSRSGRDPATVPALVQLCELLALPVAESALRCYQCYPMNHPLYQGTTSLKDADVVLVLEADVPWVPGTNSPPDHAYVAVVDLDPVKAYIPTYEFTADMRLVSGSLHAIQGLQQAAEDVMSTGDRTRFAERAAHWDETSRARVLQAEQEAKAAATKSPIDPSWLAYQISQVLDENCLLLDDTLATNPLQRYLRFSSPGCYFHNPGTGGGWGVGAAFGAKLGQPDKDVVVVTGDGFYMYSVPNAAIWAAAHYGAPFMSIVFQNRSYTTGTRHVARVYPDGYSVRSGIEGGYFDPPIDFAKEAEAAGAYGENVRDPDQVGPAIRRGLEQIRRGKPAVIAVWLPKVLCDD